MKNIFNWIKPKGPTERDVIDAADKLQLSMRTTAKCRYNAAGRLQHHGKFSFFTTTVLSLGLVFIPLIQNAGIPLAFEANVLNMMQIFLGVAVLVYSVVIGTARYEIRAEQLTECGDKLKELIRLIDKERESGNGSVQPEKLADFQRHYSDIVTDVENHERNDYRFATLEMSRDYFISGFPRLKIKVVAATVNLFGFVLPAILMLMEVVFITDMMGATEVLTDYLNGDAVSVKKNARGQINPRVNLSPTSGTGEKGCEAFMIHALISEDKCAQKPRNLQSLPHKNKQ